MIYRPQNQSLGENPRVVPDVPVSAVLLLLFVIGGASHMTLFLRNKKRGHLFAFNAMTFGLCNVRIITFALRMAWACNPTNIRIGIASGIFVYAGTVILYIANLFFSQRIIRAQHPHFGWRKPLNFVIPACIGIIVLTLIMLITVVIQSFYTANTYTHQIDRDIQLYGLTIYSIMAFLPIPFVGISTIVFGLRKQRGSGTTHDHFGHGSMALKVAVVLLSSVVLTLGVTFRAGTTYLPPTPIMKAGQAVLEPWYFTKACFYIFNFVVELTVVFGWLLVRIDQVFHVRNKAFGPWSYSTPVDAEEKNAVVEASSGEESSGDDVSVIPAHQVV